MKRLTAYVSGNVQRVGYRARIMDLARGFSLKGDIQNLEDGRVKISAEGEESDLERFLKAIDIKNTIIYVSSISKEYSEASGEFEGFYKLVGPGETDSRLDTAAVHLKELIAAVNGMNANLGGKMDQMLEMQGQMLDKQDQTVEEIKGLRQDMTSQHEDIKLIKRKVGLQRRA